MSPKMLSAGVVLAAITGLVWWLLQRTKKVHPVRGKVVLITGASSGLGEACVHVFYRAGAKVILAARRKQELERVKRDVMQIRCNIQTYEPQIIVLDLEELDNIPSKMEQALLCFGELDIVINNGGISYRGTILDTDLKVHRKVMDVNYFGQVAVTKAVLPHMIKRKTGHIVAVSSIQGKLSTPYRAPYGASKHALQAFCDCLRAELSDHNILVSVVSPGYIRTNISMNAVTGSGQSYGRCYVVTLCAVRGDRRPVYTRQAIERLSQVFGIDVLPTLSHSRAPPEFMLELYNTVAYSDGVSKRSAPYQADVVRGFPDRALRHQSRYYFNVSYVSRTEGVLAAELRLYKTRGTAHGGNSAVQLELYQALEAGAGARSPELMLLESRTVSARAPSWIVFTVTDTIRQWVNDSQTNHGFLVTARSPDAPGVNHTAVRFAQRGEHHDSKQPVLVVYSGSSQARYMYFTSNGTVPGPDSPPADSPAVPDPASLDQDTIAALREQYIQSLNEGYQPPPGLGPLAQHGYMSESQHRLLALARAAGSHHGNGDRVKRGTREPRRSRIHRTTDYFRYPARRKHKACQRGELYVDFDEIGWSGWIISPKGYNAYHCWGECPFPLGQLHRPTNHATVQSIVHTMRIEKGVQLPCCVPDKLYSISLLYFDDEENVILKQYDDMVAASCGCN